MLEKSGKNRYIIIKRTRDIKMIKIKRSISKFICIISSILITYFITCIASLDLNLFSWHPGERFGFLFAVLLSVPCLTGYCCSHVIQVTQARDESISLGYLTQNWFKKLCSAFIITFLIGLISYLIFLFCTMSLDISNINYVVRAIIAPVIYLMSFIMCLLTHNGMFTSILKIETQ